MKVTRVEARCVTIKLDKPIGSALGQLHSFGCILVFVHCDSGIIGENLIFTLNARRTRVLQSMVEEMADLVIGREAGPKIKLMADANQGLNESQAIRLGRALEEFDLTWSEEPLPAWDLDGLARVSAALAMPIASGETEYTRYGFRRMLELRSADILMPDLQRVGGVSEFIHVGHMAESHDIPVSSHLFPETSLQALGALANTIYLEYMPWFSNLYNETIEFAEGQAIVRERPGWGFTFNQDYVSYLERA